MRLLNIGCGSVRPQEDYWINLDDLHSQLLPGTPERENLDKETNYVNHDIKNPLPFKEGDFDIILCSHVIEHFDCIDGLAIMRECNRVLINGGLLIVSVPDASYFRKVNSEDNIENAVKLFGEPIHLPDGHVTFFDYALWYKYHKAILTEDALWSYFNKSGFNQIQRVNNEWISPSESDVYSKLNRLKFSLIMEGIK